jgi:hypothetical protein
MPYRTESWLHGLCCVLCCVVLCVQHIDNYEAELAIRATVVEEEGGWIPIACIPTACMHAHTAKRPPRTTMMMSEACIRTSLLCISDPSRILCGMILCGV